MAERARLYSLPGGRQDQAGPAPAPVPAEAEPLWREVLGRRLRVLRQEQEQTLAETAGRAGISPQYLSEVERGRKEPSSEMIAALAGALDTTLIDLTEQVAHELRRHQAILAGHQARPGRETMAGREAIAGRQALISRRALAGPAGPQALARPGGTFTPLALAA